MKVVEGQLQYLGLVSELSGVSNSMASQGIRQFVSAQSLQQAIAPDVLPREVQVKATIEASSGRVVNSVG